MLKKIYIEVLFTAA